MGGGVDCRAPRHLEIPEIKVERRLGGACGFGWGGPADALPSATVTVWEPPTTVQYTHDDGSFMRFDLAGDAAATTLRFTMHFLPAPENAPVLDDPGGDLPGGLDTAWRPGFLAGYHHMVDRLDDFLRGGWTRADNERELERFRVEGWDDDDLVLMESYRSYVRTSIPGGPS